MSLANATVHGFLDEVSLRFLISSAAVNVSTSIHGSGYLVGRPKRQFKLRDIEFPCYESPLLTDPAPELREIFENGKHVLFYENSRELESIARSVTRNPEQYRTISTKARLLISQKHTWSHRFKELSSIINMDLS
jgi:spore maturation protein CgeB